MTRRSVLNFLLICLIFTACRAERTTETIDLLKKLSLADLQVDTAFIDIGDSSYRNYLAHGWSAERKEKDGSNSALIATRSADLIFYCLSPSDRVLVIRSKIEPGTAQAQSYEVQINSRKIGKRSVRTKFHDSVIPIPASYLRPGQNQLRFIVDVNESKSIQKNPGISVDSVAFLSKEEVSRKNQGELLAQRPTHISFTSIADSNPKSVLQAPARSAISFYEKILPDMQLNVEFGLMPENAPKASAQITIDIQSEDAAPERLFTYSLNSGMLGRKKKSKSISLQKYANRIVRISLQSTSVPDQQGSLSSIYWSQCELVRPKQVVAAKQSTSDKRSAQRPNVILYLIDALRADHLQPYGYQKQTSPRIQQFAKESVVFERAYAQTAWTRASIATIMTGLYPSSHLTETRLDRLPDFVPTLPGELKRLGYFTQGFVTNGNVSSVFNFHRHYDQYVQLRENAQRKEIHVQSDELFGKVREFLNQPPPQPFYLYIHATDPHEPYTPAPFELDLPPGCDPSDNKMVRPDYKRRKSYDADDIECVIALYDSEIRKADFYFGEFINLLKSKNLYDSSLIFLTADHGEEFLEHQVFKHGETLYEAEIKIPLIVHFPGRRDLSGKSIQNYARHIDILPTTLDVLSAKLPSVVEGTSLLNRLGKEAFEGPVFGELQLDAFAGKYIILHPYKMIQRNKGRNTETKLFDLTRDPHEKEDLSKKKQVRFGYMRALLREWSESQQKRKALLKKPGGAILDQDTEEALRALGYVQ